MQKVSLIALMTFMTACSVGPQARPGAQTTSQSGQPALNEYADEYAAALAALQSRDYERARDMLLTLSEAYPPRTGALTNLGIAEARMGNSDKAIQCLKQATQIKPDNVIAWNWLGQQQRLRGHWTAAEEAYLAALQAKPNDARTHRNLAILYDLYADQPQAALRHYQRYQELSDTPSLIVRAWIKATQQRIDQNTLAKSNL